MSIFQNQTTPLHPLPPQRIGQGVYDLAFIMDADGIILELLHLKETLVVEMPQAW